MMIKSGISIKRVCFLILLLFIQIAVVYSQSNDDCFMCHEDSELKGEINGFGNVEYFGHVSREKTSISGFGTIKKKVK